MYVSAENQTPTLTVNSYNKYSDWKKYLSIFYLLLNQIVEFINVVVKRFNPKLLNLVVGMLGLQVSSFASLNSIRAWSMIDSTILCLSKFIAISCASVYKI